METTTLLVGAVGLIGVLHLVSRVVSVFAKGKGATASAPASRNEWYCFFSMSSLLGPDWKPFEQRERERASRQDIRRKEKRRQQAGRPRLYV